MSEEPVGSSFEEAIAQLEAVVGQLDSGQLSLEESLRAFERGIALQRHCLGILSAAQQRVEVLTEEVGNGITGEASNRLERFSRASLGANAALHCPDGARGDDPFAANDPER